jgi:uncharacterized membrane protein
MAFVAGLAAVTFPVYFVVFLFRTLILGLFTMLASLIWLFCRLIMNITGTGKKGNAESYKLSGR